MSVYQLTPLKLAVIGYSTFYVKKLLTEHLLRLKPEDCYMRFFNAMSDDSIKKYVEKIDLSDNGVFVHFDEHGTKIISFLHASRIDHGEYEFGLSVDADQRGKSRGYELFKTAVNWATSLGCKRIYVNCLYQNKAMQKIAERFNMDIRSLDFDTKEGEIMMPNNRGDMFTFLSQNANNNLLLLDLAYWRNVNALLNYFS